MTTKDVLEELAAFVVTISGVGALVRWAIGKHVSAVKDQVLAETQVMIDDALDQHMKSIKGFITDLKDSHRGFINDALSASITPMLTELSKEITDLRVAQANYEGRLTATPREH